MLPPRLLDFKFRYLGHAALEKQKWRRITRRHRAPTGIGPLVNDDDDDDDLGHVVGYNNTIRRYCIWGSNAKVM